jgi:ubiquinone/menaquinone biosynthesis C-methylase UbiE
VANLFDGAAGALMAKIMAAANREAEREAVELLDPAPDAAVLAIGFGPGVGVELLARRTRRGMIVGVDPSKAMLKAACRRNRAAIAEGRVRLACATADAVPAEDGSLDGAIAVNALQLCIPIAPTATELARVLKPGARLVALTHDWAITRHAPTVEAWVQATLGALAAAGFEDGRAFAAQAEKGHSVALSARRRA